MKTTLALIALTAALAAGPALARPACLQQDQINNWRALDQRTLIVDDTFRKRFKIKLMTICQDLQFHERLAFKVIGGIGLSCLSSGDEVIAGSDIGPQHCVIQSIEPYTPEMEKADKDAAAAARAAAH